MKQTEESKFDINSERLNELIGTLSTKGARFGVKLWTTVGRAWPISPSMPSISIPASSSQRRSIPPITGHHDNRGHGGAARRTTWRRSMPHRPGAPSELVADKGYHSRAAVLKDLNGGAWKTRIAEPKQPGFSRCTKRSGVYDSG